MGFSPFATLRSSPRRLVGAAFAALLSAGCAGEGSSLPAAGPPPVTSTAAIVSVTFTMNWAVVAQSSQRSPRYVPATARSVSISVNGKTPLFLNAPASSLAIDAPVGNDSFAFATYDGQNGQGNVLSRATVTKTIQLSVANTVSAVLGGVVASLAISLGNPSPNAGVAATVPVNVAARDADGNTIVGPGDYSAPVTLALAIPLASEAGRASLSTTALPNPATSATLTYGGGTLSRATVTASSTGVASVSATFAPKPTVYEFAIPTAGNRPQWIAAGSDGNMYFTESPGNRVGRITPAGVVTECPAVPTAASNPQGIVGATDGNLWFTEFGASNITRMTTACAYTEFSTLFASDQPQLLVDRGDGNVWYTGFSGNHVGFQGLTTGTSGETTIPTANSRPYGIASSPDNNLYFTESAVDQIGRIPMLFGAITEITLAVGSTPQQIVRGPDGLLYFTESGTSRIGQLDPNAFTVSNEFPTLTASAQPVGITPGQDGALWFTQSGLDRIGRVSTTGTMTDVLVPTTGAGVKGIFSAPDGSLYFCESNTNKIGRLVY